MGLKVGVWLGRSAGGDGFLSLVEVKGLQAADRQGQRGSGEMVVQLLCVASHQRKVCCNFSKCVLLCSLF